MTDKDELPEAHPAIEPLEFLLGRWEGFGKGDYPTIEAFDFIQEVTFTHNGKPFLIYNSRTWLKETDAEGNVAKGRPLGMETGFWRPQPNGEVEVILAHPTGISEIYLGRISANRVDLITDAVARTSSAKEVTGGKRLYGLVDSPNRPGEKDLAYAYDMAAVDQPLQPHLWAQLEWSWTE
ncbi:MAG: FABP family protein [Streptosporangiales bacterium]|nr:FABP family protein [Streptosporangiales bacterium]